MTIKVLNYAKYQDIKKSVGDTEETAGRHGGDTEVDTKEEEEKKKEIKWTFEQKEYVRKNYPHARKGKKQDTIKNFMQYAPEVVIGMVNTYKREVQV